MFRQFVVTVTFLVAAMYCFAQQNTVSGTVSDAETAETLIGVNVYIEEIPGTGASTNEYGFYSISLDPGEYTFVYSYIGYDLLKQKVDLRSGDQTVNISMGYEEAALEEIVIKGEKENAVITNTEVGVENIDVKEVDKIPVLFGEKDVLKTIQLLPGVKPAGEGNSGFFVRGGSADQNLILLDEAPVYNASHLLGFFSVFNSDAIKDLKLYKGSIPAEYGGRLSSVLDIRMKEGNKNDFGASGGIGLISSKLTLEGPIQKGKSSFIVSGRRTYADLFLALSNNEDIKNSTLYFYDLNAKMNYRLGENDRLFLSGYFGRDFFGFADFFGFDWGNTTGTLRWNHIFNPKLFSNTSLIYSDYDYAFDFLGGDFKINSSIRDFNFKHDYDYYLNNNNTMHFGVNAIYHIFDPGQVSVAEDSGFAEQELEDRYAIESAVYISNEQKIGNKLNLDYGLRGYNFSQLGPGDIYSFDTEGNITDTTTYDSNEVVASYWGLAPRFSASYVLNEQTSVKAAYARTYQNLHLLSNATSSTPTDVWLPSSNNIQPEVSDQIGLGYFLNFKQNTYEFSSEIYYKWLQNAIDYKPGAQVTLNPTVEGDLYFGRGRAYGLELYLKKKKGLFTGWISYTLARSERQFEEINDNSWYPAKQDRTHDISIVGIYQLTERLNVSGTWVYYTGNAVTFPSGKYQVNGQTVYYYDERNGDRMPDYHRLDLGVTLENKKYKTAIDPETGNTMKVPKKWQSSWNFSVYNAYARENAYSITFEEQEDNPAQVDAVRLALFKIVPSVSYNFQF